MRWRGVRDGWGRGGVAPGWTGAVIAVSLVAVGLAASSIPAADRHLLAVRAGGTILHDEVWTPAGGVTGTAPLAVLVHGGAWRPGSPAWLAEEAAALAARDWMAVSIDYRAPARDPLAVEVRDVEDGVRAARRQAAAYGDASPPTVLVGESAGGTLAALAALTGAAEMGGPVAAVVSWSGPMDPAGLVSDPSAPGWLRAAAASFAGCPGSVCTEASRSASPVHRVSPGAPPMLLFTSAHEIVPAVEADEMAAALHDAGSPAAVRVLAGRRHAVGYAAAAWPETVAFLERAAGAAPGSSPDAVLVLLAAAAALTATAPAATAGRRRGAVVATPAPDLAGGLPPAL